MTPKLAGAAVSAGLALLGAIAAAIALGYGVIDDDGRIDAGFLPIVTATVVVVTGMIDVFQRLKDKSSESESGDNGEDIFGRTQKQRNRQFAVVVGMLLVGLLLIDFLGFLLAFALLIFSISFFVERKRFINTILITAVSVFVAYMVFDQFLMVPLPMGIFGG